MIRELKEENERLKKELAGKGGSLGAGGSPSGGDEESAAKLREMEEQMRANQLAMEEMQKSWEQKLAEAKAKEVEESASNALYAKIKSVPHIVNLNEDPQLDRKVFYDLTKTENTHVGRKNGDPEPFVILGGIGIQANHAVFEKTKRGFVLKPTSSQSID